MAPDNDLAEYGYVIFPFLGLSELGAEVTAVRRGKSRIPFSPDTVLQSGDVVVVRGAAAAIEKAEKRLLQKLQK